MKLVNRQKGITIIETVVYISILALIFVIAINSVLGMGRSFSRMKAVRDLNRSSDVALERFVREAREGLSIDTDSSASTFGTHPGKLTINDVGGGSTIFEIVNGSIQITVDGVIQSALTAPNVSVSSLEFNHIISTSSEAVRMEVTFETTKGNYTASERFYSAAVLRNSYADN